MYLYFCFRYSIVNSSGGRDEALKFIDAFVSEVHARFGEFAWVTSFLLPSKLISFKIYWFVNMSDLIWTSWSHYNYRSNKGKCISLQMTWEIVIVHGCLKQNCNKLLLKTQVKPHYWWRRAFIADTCKYEHNDGKCTWFICYRGEYYRLTKIFQICG